MKNCKFVSNLKPHSQTAPFDFHHSKFVSFSNEDKKALFAFKDINEIPGKNDVRMTYLSMFPDKADETQIARVHLKISKSFNLLMYRIFMQNK